MTTRRVKVDVAVTTEAVYTGTVDIDEDEYLEWLEGARDTDRKLKEFLESGDDDPLCERIHRAGMGISGPEVYYQIDMATTDRDGS